MAAERNPITINSVSELRLVLKRAADTGETILIDTGEGLFEIDVHPSLDDDDRSHEEPDEPDAILSLIGIGQSDEPTHVARYKDTYLVDAYDQRTR